MPVYLSINVSISYIKKDILGPYAQKISYGILILSIVLTATHWDHLYTRVTFLSLALVMILNIFWIKGAYMGRYYLSYFVSLSTVFEWSMESLPLIQ